MRQTVNSSIQAGKTHCRLALAQIYACGMGMRKLLDHFSRTTGPQRCGKGQQAAEINGFFLALKFATPALA
jgi:hypothetical protein